MRTSAKQALSCWAGALVIAIAALYIFIGAPKSPDGAGEAIGRLLAHTGLAALAGWMLARNKVPSWSWPKFISIYVLALVVIAVVISFRPARADEASPFPFKISHSAGWNVQRLQGVSSLPSDKLLGVRELARWDGPEGTAMIGLSCAWRKDKDHTELADEFQKVMQGVVTGLEEHGVEVKRDQPAPTKIGPYQGLIAEMRILQEKKPKFTQLMAVALSERCFFLATLAASPDAYAKQRNEFERIVRELVID